jgi:hypothetical protein
VLGKWGEKMLNEKIASIAVALGILLGLIGGAAVLGRSVQDTRAGERYVTVRGVSEREVTADLSVWPIKVRVVGDNLAGTGQSADDARNKVLAFLDENGIGSKDVVSQNVRVLDRQAIDFAQAKTALRYIVEYTILVRSTEVAKLQKISQMTDKLVAAGVVLSSQGNWDKTTPQFLFTKLNSIKPSMMAEATRAAREVATQFAADSSSKVGSIRRASQGLFSISDRDQVASRDGDGGEGVSMAASDPNKKVRVVVTVDYFLDK